MEVTGLVLHAHILLSNPRGAGGWIFSLAKVG